MIRIRKKRDSHSNRWDSNSYDLPLSPEEFVTQREIATKAIENFLKENPQYEGFPSQTNDIVRIALEASNRKILTGVDLMIQLNALVGPCQIEIENGWKTL